MAKKKTTKGKRKRRRTYRSARSRSHEIIGGIGLAGLMTGDPQVVKAKVAYAQAVNAVQQERAKKLLAEREAAEKKQQDFTSTILRALG